MAYAADVSSLGIKLMIIAAPTFPQGFVIDQWADDADPIEFDNIDIGNAAVGVNGDVIFWKKAVMIPMAVNVIPNSTGDQNLEIIQTVNRAAKNKVSVTDDITAVVTYPDGKTITLTGGIMINVPTATSASADGRLRTKRYTFVFSNRI